MVLRMKAFCKNSLVGILLILLAGVVAYANTFQVPFVFDDERSITQNVAIQSLDLLDSGTAVDGFLPPNRYVTYLSFALNFHFGGLNVSGYHVVNLIIHLLTALLVYALLRMTLKTPFLQARSMTASNSWPVTALLSPHGFIPLFAALLFVVHPVQTQAVTYIVQRTTSLAALFYLAAVVLYVQARLLFDKREENIGRRETPARRRLAIIGRAIALLAGAVIAAVLAMKTKEIAFTLPFAVLLYEACFFRGSWKRRLIFVAPILATLPIIPLTIFAIDGPTDDVLADSAEKLRVGSDMPRLVYLLTQFRVIATYLRLLILPVNQNLDYDYPVYSHFFTPAVLVSFLLLAGICGFAVYLFYRSRSAKLPLITDASGATADPGEERSLSTRTDPEFSRTASYSRLIAFGIIWFFLTLAVESSLVPIVDVIMEHRLYLPMFGAVTVVATGFYLLMERISRPAGRRILVSIALIVVVLLISATYQRNHTWGDKISLWQDVVAKSPNKGRALNNLGVALEDAGRREEAINVLARSIAVDPGYYKSYYNLADLYVVSDRPAAALPLLQTVLRIKPDFTEAYVGMGAALMRNGQLREMIVFLEQNLDRVKNNAEARFYLGAGYAFQGQRDAALRELDILTRLDKKFAANLAGMLGMKSGHGLPHGRQ